MKITFEQLVKDSKELAKKITDSYIGIYGIPNGGTLPAYVISQELNIPLVDKIEKGVLVVDDLIDSGKTISEKVPPMGSDVAVIYRKPHSPHVRYELKEVNEWLDLPHEGSGGKAVEHNIIRLLEYIGEDPTREGLKDTPKRVVKSYKELFGGYKKDVKDVLTVFAGEEYDEMVVLKDIEFFSTCEHHILPFFGRAYVAYVPNDKVVGISKLARVVEIYSRRLQNQERLTKQIADALQKALKPKGVAVVMEAQHFCMRARGVNKQNCIMNTAYMTGIFRTQQETRKEFYDMIGRAG